MTPKIYKYAKYILDEALAPRAWRTKSLRMSIYYIHDYAHALLWQVQDNTLEDFFKRLGRSTFHVPPLSNKYPDAFRDDPFEFEYTSFQLALRGEPKNSLLYLTVLGLDIYCMSGRILHNLANARTPSAAELMELKKTCLLLEEADVNSFFYADRARRAALVNVFAPSTNVESLAPHPLHEATPKASVKDDYTHIFLEVLQHFDGEKCPAYVDIVAQLGRIYPRKKPYQGKTMFIYFENGACFVKKRSQKGGKYTRRDDRTIQNYYTAARKIHKTRFL